LTPVANAAFAIIFPCFGIASTANITKTIWKGGPSITALPMGDVLAAYWGKRRVEHAGELELCQAPSAQVPVSAPFPALPDLELLRVYQSAVNRVDVR
jgi:hypothetical protein